MDRRRVMRKLSAFALAFIIGATFVPMIGDDVYGAETESGVNGTPTNRLQDYAVYSNYMDYNSWTNYRAGGAVLFMEYCAAGGAWKRSGYMSNAVTTYKISGLKPNTKYKTRLIFVWTDGKNVYRSPYSNVVSFKTGKAKRPKVKSVKVKAVKVKKHKKKYWYIGWFTAFKTTTKYYTYKIKVTVTLKKKPGTKYIYINGKRFKGNKKKYTYTTKKQSSYSKPKGKKFTVYMYSSNQSKLIGLSPLYKKVKKVK